MILTERFHGSRTPLQVLVAEDLQKSYGPRPALRGLSFSLNAGRVLGLLGPNGAGKTTAIRILTTILEPSAGHFVIDGITSDDPVRIRSRIGVLPESLGFYRQMTGIECLTYFGQLYGRTAAEARTYGLALLEEVGLRDRARSLIATYSRGMRQRLGIARTLVNDPVVVFLDEPTLGLDPRGQQEIMALGRRIAQERNAGVVWCSHVLSEIEEVCDDVLILSAGQVVARGSVNEIVRQAQRQETHRPIIRIHVPVPSVAGAHQVLDSLPNVVRVTPTSGGLGWLEAELLSTDEQNAADELGGRNRVLDALIRADVPILSFETSSGRLQEVFLQLTAELTG